jgi:hypothetical protein
MRRSPVPPQRTGGEAIVRRTAPALEGLTALAAVGGGGAMIDDPKGAMGLRPYMLDRLSRRRASPWSRWVRCSAPGDQKSVRTPPRYS